MKNISLYYLILRLSKAIKTSNHLDLLFLKEALITYYNEFGTHADSVHRDFVESLGRYLCTRCVTESSHKLMNAIVTHLVVNVSIETAKEIVGDLIHKTNASLYALEEAKCLRIMHSLKRGKGKYYYSGSCNSDIAEVRYVTVGESRGNGGHYLVNLISESSGLPSDLVRQLLYSCF